MSLAGDAANSLGPGNRRKQQITRNRWSTAAIIFLAVIVGVGCNCWRGFGFRAVDPRCLG